MYHKGFANSSRSFGAFSIGKNAFVSQGAILRSHENSLKIGDHSGILENCVVIGYKDQKTTIGSKTIFGHSTIILGSKIGNLCEVGNGSLFMPGSEIGDFCILGEGTIIPKDKIIPSRSVIVGRPGRVIRRLTDEDLKMIKSMRNNNISLSDYKEIILKKPLQEGHMGTLHRFKGKVPKIHPSAILYDTAEITGDVTIGEDSIIASGVKIIGDSHGHVEIGNRVQILENSVLHLLPGNQLILHDDVIIGPGCVVHGCIIEKGSIIESASTICDDSHLGENCRVKAGSLVKQNTTIESNSVVEGFPAKVINHTSDPLEKPQWIIK